jgi:hypothetical protein
VLHRKKSDILDQRAWYQVTNMLAWFTILPSLCRDCAVYISRAVLLLIIAAYVFSPSAFSWMVDPGGTWYRPYLIWMTIVFTTFVMQPRHDPRDEEG